LQSDNIEIEMHNCFGDNLVNGVKQCIEMVFKCCKSLCTKRATEHLK